MTGPWTCPTGEQWSRYLLDPQLPGREQLARHLQECEFCRIKVTEAAQQLDELADEWRTADQPDTIILSALSDADAEQAAATLLAAEGGEHVPLAESATLASAGQEMFLRVVRDQRSGEIWLYVIADDPARCRNVIVKPFGRDDEYVTDDQGRVNLGKADWPAPGLLTAEVHLPRASFTLVPLPDFGEQGESVVLTSPGGDRIQVVFTGSGRNRRLEIQLLERSAAHGNIPLKIAVRGAGGVGVLQVQLVVSNRASFERIDAEGALEIYLYQ